MIVGHQLHHIWQWKKVLLVDTSKIQLITASTIKHLSYSEGLNRKSSTGFAIFVCVEDTTFTWCLKKKPFATLFYLWSWLCCICLFLRAILLQNLSKMLCTSQETPPIFIMTLINIALGENLHHMNEHMNRYNMPFHWKASRRKKLKSLISRYQGIKVWSLCKISSFDSGVNIKQVWLMN